MSASAQVRRMKKQLKEVEERYQANLKVIGSSSEVKPLLSSRFVAQY